MMLSVLVWLAMQGQVQAQTTYGQRSYCVIGKNFASNCTQAEIDEYTWANGSPIESVDSETWGLTKVKPRRAKPAEHVIEIKTRRENEPCRDSTDGPDTATFTVNLPKCVKTRELWIDGVRWGIIKGLD